MAASRATSLILPEDVVSRVRAHVESGEFADEAAVVVEGLRALEARDDAVESWLRADVVRAWDEHRSDPSRAKSVEQVRAGLQARYQRAIRGHER